MAWLNAEVPPFTPTARLHFSPIVTDNGDYIVYIRDEGTNFYKYNMSKGIYTQLAATNYDSVNCRAELSISPDGLKIATLTDRDGATGNNSARRVEIYTIATNLWVASAQAPDLAGGYVTTLSSMVWIDNDSLYFWGRRRAAYPGAIFKYVISTTTWSQDGSLYTPTNSVCQNMAMNATDVYMGAMGNATDNYTKWNIAGDTYTPTDINKGFESCYDRDKLWFTETDDYRQGYIDTADDSVNTDQFPINSDLTATAGKRGFGVTDDGGIIIAQALSASPYIMYLATPYILTFPMTDITGTTATGNGYIVSIGQSAITQHGHCWATSVDPTTADSKTTNGAGSLGSFTSSLTSLVYGTKYYSRAYVTNSEGTYYGANIAFVAGYSYTQMYLYEISIVGTTFHYTGADGKEYYIQGTAL